MRTVTIKPFVNDETDHIGLNKIGLNSFPQTKKVFPIPIKNRRYLTGLDVNAEYLSLLPEDIRKEKIKEIEKECKQLDKLYPHLKLCDCSESNEYYQSIEISIGAENTYLNLDSIDDYIRYKTIKVLAETRSKDSIVALSLRDVVKNGMRDRFYIADESLDAEEEVRVIREQNKAIRLLDEMFTDNKNLMNVMLKYFMPADRHINKLSESIKYSKLNGIIKGDNKGENVEPRYQEFIIAANKPIQELEYDVVLKYALDLLLVKKNSGTGKYYIASNGIEIGKSQREMLDFLKAGKNFDEYVALRDAVDEQIKITG